MTPPIRAEAQPYISLFESQETSGLPRWLIQARKQALAWFAEKGFPTPNQEEWRFTNMTPITSIQWAPVHRPSRPLTPEDVRPLTFGRLDCHRLVFVDGHFVPALSLLPDDGIEVGSVRDLLVRDPSILEKHLGRGASFDQNAFSALNLAFFTDGGFVRIPAHHTAARPVHLLFISTTTEPGATILPRNLILAEPCSSATIIESYASLSGSKTLTNTVTELILGHGSKVDHCKIQSEGPEAFHVGTVFASQAADSSWRSHSISTGARIARHQITSALDGTGASCLFNGLYMAEGDQLVDHHTLADHLQPQCESREFYHGILDGSAHGVFNGKIYVHSGAQKTDARQTNRNLLLSNSAIIDSKPQLEIYADDVKCSHGATVGQLDEEQLFYLRARGIGLEAARRMLIHAFASEVVARVPDAAVRAFLDNQLESRFACQTN